LPAHGWWFSPGTLATNRPKSISVDKLTLMLKKKAEMQWKQIQVAAQLYHLVIIFIFFFLGAFFSFIYFIYFGPMLHRLSKMI
jgi:hypothetical protein